MGGGEAIAPVPKGLNDMKWKHFTAFNTDDPLFNESGFKHVADAASATTVVGGLDTRHAVLKSGAAGPFVLESLVAGSAWNDGMTLKIKAYANGVLVGKEKVTLDYGSPTTLFFDEHFVNVDTVSFRWKGGTDANPADDGFGENVALDDFTFGALIGKVADWAL